MKGSAFGFRNSKKLTRLLLCSASGLAVLATPQLAYAQAAPADEEATEEVIIVTARKQDETLQEVPVTITSVGADTLDKYNVDEVSDVTSRIPTLNIQVGGSGSGGQISLRGVGSSNISASFDSAVAFDYDGIQVSTMRMVQSAFFDTAQIDVLKGPQSLYFGKSASAGVFSIKSKDPTSSWEVGGKAAYEFEERGYTIGGYISAALTTSNLLAYQSNLLVRWCQTLGLTIELAFDTQCGELVGKHAQSPTGLIGGAMVAISEDFRRSLRFVSGAKRTDAFVAGKHLLAQEIAGALGAIGGDDHPAARNGVFAKLGQGLIIASRSLADSAPGPAGGKKSR